MNLFGVKTNVPELESGLKGCKKDIWIFDCPFYPIWVIFGLKSTKLFFFQVEQLNFQKVFGFAIQFLTILIFYLAAPLKFSPMQQIAQNVAN